MAVLLPYYRFFLKKFFIRSAASSANMPPITIVLGCSAWGAYLRYPLFSSLVPYTSFPICDHAMAPAHITHGSTVTYSVHVSKYFPLRYSSAAVTACISACAVTSWSVSVRLCPFPIIWSLHTTTAPIGTSSFARAFLASARATFM